MPLSKRASNEDLSSVQGFHNRFKQQTNCSDKRKMSITRRNYLTITFKNYDAVFSPNPRLGIVQRFANIVACYNSKLMSDRIIGVRVLQ